METKIYCNICGAENEIKGSTASFCYNCDNALGGKACVGETNISVSDTLSRIFAYFYLVIFAISSLGYLLSIGDATSASSAAGTMFLIPIVFHSIWTKWAEEIKGVYKGKNRFVFVRSLVLYSVITLTIYEIITFKIHKNMDRIDLVFLMLFSLILFYSYFFGKKHTIFNYFKFS